MRTKTNSQTFLVSAFKKITALIIIPSTLIIFNESANAVKLQGKVTDFYQSFSGTLSPVEVDLGSGLVSTGEISYSLDLTNPSEQKFTFDFDTMTAAAELDFHVTFPLLQSLGLAPIKIHVSESGPIISGVPDLPVENEQNLQFRALLTGGGVVNDGSIFSGLEYKNLNDTNVTKNVNVASGGQFSQPINGGGNINVKIEGTIQSPGSNPQVTVGTGGATIGTKPVPEPLTILGSSMALGFGALFKKEYSRKQKKAKTLVKQKA